MALKVEVHALAETVLAEERSIHAHDFRPLFVHRQRVEIVHLDVGVRTDGVGHGARVFRKLRRAQPRDVFDPLDRARVAVGRKLLVPVHGEPFLERELKPVPARDPVAGPVVEILVPDDALDPRVVAVGRRRGRRQHQPRIEDVERLVLHGAHDKVGDGDDIEEVEVVLEAVRFFVPPHRLFQGFNRVPRLGRVLGLGVKVEVDGAAGRGGERVGRARERARDQRKEVARLGERVVPHRVVPAAAGVARVDQVAVGQEDGAGGRVGFEAGRVARHDVRPVREKRDPAKPFRLALRAEVAARHVQALEGRVGRGREGGDDLQVDRAGGERRQHQLGAARGHLVRGEGGPVDLDGDEGDVVPAWERGGEWGERAAARARARASPLHLLSLTLERQRRRGRPLVRGCQRQRGRDGRRVAEAEVEVDLREKKRKREGGGRRHDARASPRPLGYHSLPTLDTVYGNGA